MKVIDQEAGTAKKEAAMKKKQIRDGKRKVAKDVGAQAPKQMSRAYGLATMHEQYIVVNEILDGNGVCKKGKKKHLIKAISLRWKRYPGNRRMGLLMKSGEERVMDMELLEKKCDRVWICGEEVSSFVNVSNIVSRRRGLHLLKSRCTGRK